MIQVHTHITNTHITNTHITHTHITNTHITNTHTHTHTHTHTGNHKSKRLQGHRTSLRCPPPRQKRWCYGRWTHIWELLCYSMCHYLWLYDCRLVKMTYKFTQIHTCTQLYTHAVKHKHKQLHTHSQISLSLSPSLPPEFNITNHKPQTTNHKQLTLNNKVPHGLRAPRSHRKSHHQRGTRH
jgi:hypothetical protein